MPPPYRSRRKEFRSRHRAWADWVRVPPGPGRFSLFDGAALRGIQEKLVAFLVKRGEITVPEFKEMTGLSRKYIIPLLEHFDATKVTLRVGDKRVLRKGK